MEPSPFSARISLDSSSRLSLSNFRIPSSKWGKKLWDSRSTIASVFKHRAGKNGLRNQGNATLHDVS